MQHTPAADPKDDVFQSVRKRFDELTRSQKLIAEAIVEDPEFVALGTARKFVTVDCFGRPAKP